MDKDLRKRTVVAVDSVRLVYYLEIRRMRLLLASMQNHKYWFWCATVYPLFCACASPCCVCDLCTDGKIGTQLMCGVF